MRSTSDATVGSLEEIQWQIRDESRQSHRTQTLTALPDGRFDFGSGPMYFERRALLALAKMNRATLPRAGALLVELEPSFRSDLLNRQLRERDYHLRTRLGPTGERQVYAVLSDSYQVFDADVLIDRLLDDVYTSGLSGRATYNPATTDFQVSLLREIEVVEHAQLGDVFRWGLRYSTNDAGRGSIRGSAVIERLACLNMAEFYTERAAFASLTHSSGVERRFNGHRIPSLMPRAERLSCSFVDQWDILRNRSWRALGPEIEDAYEALIDMAPRHLAPRVLGRRRAFIVAVLVKGWNLERGGTLADLINGITAAHKLNLPAPIVARLEAAAGRLVPLLATY